AGSFASAIRQPISLSAAVTPGCDHLHARFLIEAHAASTQASQLIIQGMPKRSITIPKRSDQNVFSIGYTTRPPLASSWKTLSAPHSDPEEHQRLPIHVRQSSRCRA